MYNPDQEKPEAEPMAEPNLDQSPSETAAETASSDFSTDDLDRFEIPPEFSSENAGDGTAGEGGAAASDADVYISQDQFFAVFLALIGSPNMAINPPLQSLMIDQSDPSARQASDALYETCCEVPWLRWMVRPEGKWAQRGLPIAVFVMGLQAAVREEMHARHMRPTNPSTGASASDRPPSSETATAGEGGYSDDGVVELKTTHVGPRGDADDAGDAA